MKWGLGVILTTWGILTGNALFAQTNSTYRELIGEADLYLKAGNIGFARIDFEKAVRMNPSDEYPRLRLAEIDRKAANQRHNDSLFEQSLLNAEKYFQSNNFSLAQVEYQRALTIKPESVFIKERLAAIAKTGIVAAPAKTTNDLAPSSSNAATIETTTASIGPLPARQEAADPISKKISPTKESGAAPTAQKSDSPSPLQTALTQAEGFFAAKDYENAVQQYQAALALKPADKQIKSKLATARALLDQQKRDQQAYKDLLIAGEKANIQKNTALAISHYGKAALMKPDDANVQGILNSLRDRLNVEQQQEKDYKAILTKADSALHDNNLAEAKKGYEVARNIRPEEKYPQEKLLEISRIEAIAEAEKSKQYKELLVLAESLSAQEEFQGALEAFNKAATLQPKESYPKEKITQLTAKIKELEAQYKIAYSGYIADAAKAYQAKNWDVAMDNYLKGLKAKPTDTLAGNQVNRIGSYLDSKLVTTLSPPAPQLSVGKEIKLSFKAIEPAKKRNQYLVVRVKNSAAGNPRLYLNYGQDGQKNGGLLYRNLVKGSQFIDYVIRIVNQDRWYRLDNNWIALSVEGGSLEVESLKICADI